MKHPIHAKTIFQNWLKSDDCYPTVELWGKRLIAKVQELNLPESVWPYSRVDDPQICKEVIHDFWIFLMQYPDKLNENQNPIFESQILKGNMNRILNDAFQAYLQTQKAEARKKETDPWRYVYRRVRETLNYEKKIYYRLFRHGQRDKKGWPYFSLDSKADLLNNVGMLHIEPYSEWETPLNIISEMQFSRFKRKHFLELSIFFWKQAVSKLGKPYFLPIREIMRFLEAHYQTIVTNTLLSLEDLSHKDNNKGGESTIPSHQQFESNILESLAERLIESWPYERKACFAFKYETPDMTFRKIAERLGMKRHSNAQYHYEKAISHVKDFCSEWPGPTLPHVEKDFFLEFTNKVAELCKKTFNGHN